MAEDDRPFHNPFGALRGLVGSVPDASTDSTEGAPAAAPSRSPGQPPVVTAAPVKIPRAVVRLERSGRGGKEVTVVEHLAVNAAARGEWLKALKASLGCGGHVEDDRLVLQGDQRARLPALLEARGVKKVTIG